MAAPKHLSNTSLSHGTLHYSIMEWADCSLVLFSDTLNPHAVMQFPGSFLQLHHEVTPTWHQSSTITQVQILH